MLLNLLKGMSSKKITLVGVGFDSFSLEAIISYFDSMYQNERHVNEFDRLNEFEQRGNQFKLADMISGPNIILGGDYDYVK